MAQNELLRKAKKQKNDEFYTQYVDVEKEIIHYVEYFRCKVIYCNCDDENSNFFKYFSDNFKLFGLKKLIVSCFKKEEVSYKLECSDENDIIKTHLLGDGDFRSNESIELLKEADIIITNPPFSLFREYVAQLVEYDKKFIILGHQNAITYKDIFKLIKENKIWLGVDNGGTKWFKVPEHYDIETETRIKTENGQKYFSMGSLYWFTNLDNRKRNEDLILYKTFYGNENEYPKYDNYDVINVDKVSDIPLDYKGNMGVPITFIDKYNPEQFEILGIANSARWIGFECYTIIEGKKIYNRIIIKKKREL